MSTEAIFWLVVMILFLILEMITSGKVQDARHNPIIVIQMASLMRHTAFTRGSSWFAGISFIACPFYTQREL